MNAVNDRLRDIGEFVPAADDDRIICRCEEITKGEIRRAVHDWIESGSGLSDCALLAARQQRQGKPSRTRKRAFYP